jgi:aldose 1-epimerase
MKSSNLIAACAAAVALVGCTSNTKQSDAGPQGGSQADANRPDVAQPDVAQPDVAQPDVAQPDVAQPDVARPDVTQPDVARPDISQADANQADANQQDANQQDANQGDGSTLASDSSYMELKRENFQTVVAGKNVDLYTIANSKGMFAKITNFGAKIEQIVVPDKDGVFGDVVLGYDTIAGVQGGQLSMGAFIGRYANRIAGGTFTMDGVTYLLPINETSPAPRNNTLHGGTMSSRVRVFDAVQSSSSSVQMSLDFLDAEDAADVKATTPGTKGFPGKLSLKVVYTVTDANELQVDYSATTDKKTVVNFTCHPFFNLSNTPGSSILDHQITVNASKVLDINAGLIPTGTLLDLTLAANAPMDFRTAKTFRRDYQANYPLLNLVAGGGTVPVGDGGTVGDGGAAGIAGGYDNTYVLDKSADGGSLTFAARAYEPVSGRTLEVWSTEPSMQLFSGNNLAGQSPRDLGKGGVLYQEYSGFAMEPMHYPDSPNQPSFPSTVLDASKTYQGQIVYKFGTKP